MYLINVLYHHSNQKNAGFGTFTPIKRGYNNNYVRDVHQSLTNY